MKKNITILFSILFLFLFNPISLFSHGYVIWEDEKELKPEYTPGILNKFGLGIFPPDLAINHDANFKLIQFNPWYGKAKDLYGFHFGGANAIQGGKYEDGTDRISNFAGISFAILANQYGKNTNSFGFTYGALNYFEGKYTGISFASLNVVKSDHAGMLTGFAFNQIDADFTGMSISIGNFISKNFNGIAISGLVGWIKLDSEFKGVYVGGILNTFRGEMKGVLLGGVFNSFLNNFTGLVLGFQNYDGLYLEKNPRGKISGVVIGLFNDLRDPGVTIGISNIIRGDLSYVSAGGINIIKKDSSGFNFGVFGNYVGGNNNGTEIGTLGNINMGVSYSFQFGAFNYAEESKGIQIGLINYTSKKARFQIGLLNIALENPIPVFPFINFSLL
ncbi:MAG: hypothetical protein H7A23_24455 [Leptospiraceae bacterium]|nr:hypothetical protein [Leptospiraceae bacterium]MCP5497718.1 hypothetical protein [Leptospiraceae bacterium]